MLLGLTLVSLQQLKHNTLPTQVLTPVNICKSSRHVLKTSSTLRKCNGFLSSKTSSRHVFKTSSAILQRNKFNLPRRLQDVLQYVFKTSRRHLARRLARRLGRRKIVTLMTSSRRLGDKQYVYWRHLYLTMA